MNHIFDRKLSHGNNKERTPFSAVYLAAGLSSRFGYRIKCLQEVGRLGETLLELSIRQLAKYGLSDVIIVVSRSTYPKVHLVAGDIFQGIPVTYCFQETPSYRKKPLGTVHALLCAKDVVDKAFIVLNGDTLYGEHAISNMVHHIQLNEIPCMPGYRLIDVLPREGKVNRAIVNTQHDWLVNIVEQYDISMEDIRNGLYTGNELTSMNIFAFRPDIFGFMENKLKRWLEQNPHEPSKEYILSTMLNDLYAETGKRTRVFETRNVPLELTNPEDFGYVKNNLDLVGF
ncbi:hypothetical protein GAYE_SCF18G3838 [Galdieria yellowstonensis]|uniref:MobA-like NTP transferase domain-containing protein n=1 Tax=Galdieria yellowstonensis TaxID=3028027 RepID=A0AAV9IF44_9RHOD|nr:hypothetical protein GAYE_SCF18G3838 [Galdieria yellowstonensis]